MRKVLSLLTTAAVAVPLVLVLTATTSSAVAAQPLQEVRTLDFPEAGLSVAANAVNNSGAIAGTSSDASDDERPHGYVTDPTNTSTTDLQPLDIDSDLSNATALNDAGQAVGSATNVPGDDSPGTATVWGPGGGATDLGTIGQRPCTLSDEEEFNCDTSSATGINNNGIVVGRSDRDNGSGGRITHAFVDRLATMDMIDIGTLTGGATSEALGVNDSGLVVGDSQTSDGHGGTTTHAFVYDMATATMTDIGTLPGGTSSVARAVNVHGLVVGDSTVVGGAVHPFTYDTTTHVMTDIGLPPGVTNAGASAVNDNGVVVGSADGGAYVYNPADRSFAIIAGARNAKGINDAGEVVGEGTVPDSGFPQATDTTFGAYFTFVKLSPPAAPRNLRITTACGTAPLLRWTASPPTALAQPDAYIVFRNGLMIAKVTGTAYSDTSAPAPSSYTVAATNVDGLSPMSNRVTWMCQPGVTGTVTSAGSPIAGIDVRAYASGTTTLAAKAQTDSAGHYGLPSLAAGSYNLRFSDAAGRVVLAWNGGAASQAAAAPVVVTPGTAVTVDAALVAAGHISGTDGVNGEVVRVYLVGGSQVAKVIGGDGTYDVGGLAPGSYQVLFTDPSQGTVTVWNGGVADRSVAPAVTVTAGASTEVDVSPPAAAVVHGTATSATDGTPLAGIDVRIYVTGTDTLAAKTVTAADGSYTFVVLPGVYQIRFSDPANVLPIQWATGALKQSHATSFTLTAGGSTTVDVSLIPRIPLGSPNPIFGNSPPVTHPGVWPL